MKKRVAIIFSCLCLAAGLGLTACGQTNETIQPSLESTVSEVVKESTPLPQKEEGKVIFNQDGIKITCLGFDYYGSFAGPTLKLKVENNRKENITVQVRDESINGYMLEGSCSIDVSPGKVAIDEILWLSPYFEEIGITKVDNIEFYFHIFNWDTFNTIVDSETISLNF
jgi:hypothetical protein